jgi:hypothetical protein
MGISHPHDDDLVARWALDESDPTDDAVDAGPNGLTGIKWINNPTVEVGKIDGARGFGGVGLLTNYLFYVNDTALLRVQLHTICGWFKVLQSGKGGWLVGKRQNSAQPSYLLTTVGGASGTDIAYQCAFTDNPATLRRIDIGRDLDPGYYHVAGVFDGAWMRLYIDGVQEASSNQVGSGIIDYSGAHTLGIGADPGATIDRWQGDGDDVSLYSGAKDLLWIQNAAEISHEAIEIINKIPAENAVLEKDAPIRFDIVSRDGSDVDLSLVTISAANEPVFDGTNFLEGWTSSTYVVNAQDGYDFILRRDRNFSFGNVLVSVYAETLNGSSVQDDWTLRVLRASRLVMYNMITRSIRSLDESGT